MLLQTNTTEDIIPPPVSLSGTDQLVQLSNIIWGHQITLSSPNWPICWGVQVNSDSQWCHTSKDWQQVTAGGTNTWVIVQEVTPSHCQGNQALSKRREEEEERRWEPKGTTISLGPRQSINMTERVWVRTTKIKKKSFVTSIIMSEWAGREWSSLSNGIS